MYLSNFDPFLIRWLKIYLIKFLSVCTILHVCSFPITFNYTTVSYKCFIDTVFLTLSNVINTSNLKTRKDVTETRLFFIHYFTFSYLTLQTPMCWYNNKRLYFIHNFTFTYLTLAPPPPEEKQKLHKLQTPANVLI